VLRLRRPLSARLPERSPLTKILRQPSCRSDHPFLRIPVRQRHAVRTSVMVAVNSGWGSACSVLTVVTGLVRLRWAWSILLPTA